MPDCGRYQKPLKSSVATNKHGGVVTGMFLDEIGYTHRCRAIRGPRNAWRVGVSRVIVAMILFFLISNAVNDAIVNREGLNK